MTLSVDLSHAPQVILNIIVFNVTSRHATRKILWRRHSCFTLITTKNVVRWWKWNQFFSFSTNDDFIAWIFHLNLFIDVMVTHAKWEYINFLSLMSTMIQMFWHSFNENLLIALIACQNVFTWRENIDSILR